MLLITCPICGARAAETEFHPGGEAHLARVGAESADGDDAAFEAYLFLRRNPRGVHFERWRHQYGCGKWFNLARDTVSLEIFGAYAVDAPEPPEDILRRIAERTAG